MGPNKAFFILIISFTISLFGLTTVLMKSVLLMFSHAVYICQKTFTNVIFTLSHSVPLILITFVILILFIGAIVLVVQVLKTRSYLRSKQFIDLRSKQLVDLKEHLTKQVAIPNKLKIIASDLNLNRKIDLVKDENKLSFCYGIFSPRICLSSGLIKSLKPKELKAVLLHESYHLQNYDPLKIILSKTASLMFFFIPILKDTQHHYALSKEIAADKIAIKYGNRESLLSVLNKLLVAPMPAFNSVAALASLDDLEKRILYLTDNQRRITFRPSLVNTLLSIIIVVFSFMIVNIPVYAVSAHEGSMEHSLFICPFGDKCTLSCKAKEEEDANYSKGLMYTPMNYTPK